MDIFFIDFNISLKLIVLICIINTAFARNEKKKECLVIDLKYSLVKCVCFKCKN